MEAKCAQQAIKLLSEFLSGCYRLTQTTVQNQSSGQPSDPSFPSPAFTVSLAVDKGLPPTGASAAMSMSLPSNQSSASPASSCIASKPDSLQQPALASANSSAATPLKDSNSTKISARRQEQGQLHGTGAVVSDWPQMTKSSQASKPSVNRREGALQTGKAATSVQLATLPDTLKDDGTQCIELWRQSCSCLLPPVGQVTPHACNY